MAEGLSPRVRGIRRHQDHADGRQRSIPACTGNPRCRHHNHLLLSVYPRVYGESIGPGRPLSCKQGLSPRVRGIQTDCSRHIASWRSIPACTGNPAPPAQGPVCIGVYPRVYGESFPNRLFSNPVTGLSPRVRGIQQRRLDGAGQHGSIPACTGNPPRRPATATTAWVYPRVYGESSTTRWGACRYRGLSPRVRGIPAPSPSRNRTTGSIPACTGNPPSRPRLPPDHGVYPRVYGESMYMYREIYQTQGLSPRVRGIPAVDAHPPRSERSIPACTGNPAPQSVSCADNRVYPRVYGESRSTSIPPSTSDGLSPRVRGIHELIVWDSDGTRSIPACTGNPLTGARAEAAGRVYPRVYGESRCRIR